MPKQTKMIKFMFAVLLLIPVVLFVTGIVQTFVLKSRQRELYGYEYSLSQAEQEKNELQIESDYKDPSKSDTYKEEKDKHNGYSKNDDIKLN